MCHGQMITIPRREPNGASCDICKRTVPTGEKVTIVQAKRKGQIHKLTVCRDHNITAAKLQWKLRGFIR